MNTKYLNFSDSSASYSPLNLDYNLNNINYDINDYDLDDEICAVGGTNDFSNCNAVPATESHLFHTTNLMKYICGAGSFSLPYVFLDQEITCSILALGLCGMLASITMKSLHRSKTVTQTVSYVELETSVLGEDRGHLVLEFTLEVILGCVFQLFSLFWSIPCIPLMRCQQH